MTIKELHSETNNKCATIELNYDEIRDIANGLYELGKLTKFTTSFHKIHRDMAFLFNIVKHGCIDSNSIRMLERLQDKLDESRKGDAK